MINSYPKPVQLSMNALRPDRHCLRDPDLRTLWEALTFNG